MTGMDWDRAARNISREGGTRMMDAYAMLEHDAEVFARAARCLETLPGTDRILMEDAFRLMGRFGGGMTPAQASILCRMGMAATRRAAALDPA